MPVRKGSVRLHEGIAIGPGGDSLLVAIQAQEICRSYAKCYQEGLSPNVYVKQ